MNMTLDGYCDHTSMMADEEIHDHYTELLNSAGTLLYGRITYQLMYSYWPSLLTEPSDNKAMNDFAVAIDRIEKVVFSRTMKSTNWKTARIATQPLKDEVESLRKQPGADIFVGSPGLIVSYTNLDLIDEYQISVHPVIAGKGLPLFRSINERVDLKLLRTKTFACGAVLFYYQPVKK